MGVILLDTVNRSKAAGKVTERDERALEFLLQQTDWGSLKESSFLVQSHDHANRPRIDMNKLYDYLSSSKYDPVFWNQLSVTDALRLDYKQFHAADGSSFGASSILLPMNDFLAKSNLSMQVSDYLKTRNIPVLVVLSMFMKDGTPQRSMAILSPNQDLLSEIGNFFLTSNEAMSLRAAESTSGPTELERGLFRRSFDQANPKASRKQVVPVLLEFYKQRK
jgi:inorganic pyrophosphatase/exopolyphosphatase